MIRRIDFQNMDGFRPFEPVNLRIFLKDQLVKENHLTIHQAMIHRTIQMLFPIQKGLAQYWWIIQVGLRNSTNVTWRAEVTIGGIKDGVFIPLGTMTYGFDIKNGKLSVVAPQVSQPTPWHRDSFTNKSKW